MTRRTAPLARGYLLGQLIVVLAILAVLTLLLGKLILDGLYVQRVAHEHATHVAVADDLARRLSRDTLAAIHAIEESDGVRLRAAGPAGTSEIRYVIDEHRVRRIVDGVEAGAWSARRLRFDGHVETGPRGRVLLLNLLIDRPPRASDVLPMAFSRGFVLPAADFAPAVRAPEDAP